MCHLRVLPGRRCWTVPSPSGNRGGKALSGSPVCYLRLQRTLRSRLVFCVISLMAQGVQGAASRRRPLHPRAPASNIATAWCLRLIPAGFGSGRGSVRAKHGPQPASMRAAPACRERLSDVEAATPAVSTAPGPAVIWDRRPGQAQPPPGNMTGIEPDIMPGGAALTRAQVEG